MVMPAYLKTVYRTVKSNTLRFVAMIAIVFIGICFVTGVGGISPKVTDSIDDALVKANAPDIILKSKSELGFSDGDLNHILNYKYTKEAAMLTVIDTKIMEQNARIYVYPMDKSINRLKLISGRLPENDFECVVEKSSNTIKKVELNSQVTCFGSTFTVCGIVQNPLIYSNDGEVSSTNQELLDLIIYLDENNNVMSLPKTDIYIKLNTTNSYFSVNYFKKVNSSINELKENPNFNDEKVAFLTMNENKSYVIVTTICDKVDVIALLFPIFFILVVSLVVLTTMSRLIDEERLIIGCYKSLGYANIKILMKYLLFSLFSTIIGIIFGLFIGAYLLPNIIYPAFNGLFILPSITKKMSLETGIYSSLAMFILVEIVTVYVSIKSLNEEPASLLLPKTPKAGRKIFLEHVSFVWKRLKFKYKSTYRNIFRYVGRLLMVVISVSGSTALIMAGLGLNDVSKQPIFINGIYMDIGDALTPISIAIIIFALALCILVLFNLTNMNIGERKREIATLKVLGYVESEVQGYIFREILIMSIIGIILGIPLGIGLLSFIFSYLNFGSLSDISFLSYLLTIIISLIFVFIVDLLLCPKIKHIDMNDSLKSIE